MQIACVEENTAAIDKVLMQSVRMSSLPTSPTE